MGQRSGGSSSWGGGKGSGWGSDWGDKGSWNSSWAIWKLQLMPLLCPARQNLSTVQIKRDTGNRIRAQGACRQAALFLGEPEGLPKPASTGPCSACGLYLEGLARPQLTGDASCPSGPRPLALTPLGLPLWASPVSNYHSGNTTRVPLPLVGYPIPLLLCVTTLHRPFQSLRHVHSSVSIHRHSSQLAHVSAT
jgi:hypothetical protein